MKINGYLIVRADGTMRTTKKAVRLGIDEVAFRLNVTIPAMWGKVQAPSIDIDLPEPPEAVVNVGEAETGTFEYITNEDGRRIPLEN